MLSRTTGARAVAVAAALAVSLPDARVGAQAPDGDPLPLPIPALAAPIRLDGRADEAAWRAVEPLPMTMYEPTFRGPMSERTEIRVAHDGEHLWVAATLHDSRPDLVRSNSLYRDRERGDDQVGIVLDTFDDNENALWFATNPDGVRFDRAVSRDAQGDFDGLPVNDAWNTFWDVAAERTASGWSAELRIPLSSLGLEAPGGRARMGLLAYRYVARKNERHTFPAVPPDWRLGYAKPSLARTVVLDGVRSETSVTVAPYVLAGLSEGAGSGRASGSGASTPPGSGASGRTLTREAGLDVKLEPRPNLTVDLTFNTDFAQVEADEQRVNLTRFDLFFSEKRAFFQERASIFDVPVNFLDRLFHSRRIGLDRGEPVPVLGGARVVGRFGPWDVGAMSLQTEATRRAARSSEDAVELEAAGLPSENFGLLRARRRVLNPYSTVGALLTTRVGDDGSYNTVLGWDATLRVREDDYVTLQWVESVDDSAVARGGWSPVRSALARARWERRTQRGFNFAGEVQSMGGDFRADVGFFQRHDFTRFQGWLGYGWLPGRASAFRAITPNFLFVDLVVSNDDGKLDTGTLASFFNYQLKSGATGWLGIERQEERLRGALDLADAMVPAGRYAFYNLNAFFQSDRRHAFSGDVDLNAGTFYDGHRVSLGLTPSYVVSKHLEVSGSYDYDRVRFGRRDLGFDAHVGRVSIRAARDEHLSLSLFLQYVSLNDLLTPSARIRYNVREGRDLWIAYDEAFGGGAPGGVDRAGRTGRVLLVKYVHTFGR